MKFIARYQYLLGGILLGAVTVYLVSTVTTEKRLAQLQLSLDASIEAARTEVFQGVSETETGGSGSKVTAIIADCTESERDTFESILVKLDLGLTRAELDELDRLFSRCAPVQSVRRTLVVMDLSRRLEKFAALLEQRKQIGDYTTYDRELESLTRLVSLEEDITEVSFDLVLLQRQIIDDLLGGGAVDSDLANEFRGRGVTLRTSLNKLADEARIIRTELRES